MSKQLNFAVVLSGCGVYDGSEIHEATLTLLAISKHGSNYEIFAPDINQAHVVNHLTGEEMPETRNVLVESARIARGKIKNLKDFSAKDFDAIVFPGGFGAAKNLSNYAFDGEKTKVNPEVEKAVREMYALKKPIAALCIAPVIIAKILSNVKVTIGSDPATAADIQKFGAFHIITDYKGVAIDKENLIFTSPCYMIGTSIAEVAEGVENLIRAIIESR
ncbi:MAG: isoprenoid biosynthesis protein ElbB [Bacteroidetes bacterium RIFOXYA12_FULL_35_11]|nr:MAG: isoprenoid biosynthesis protein ElbB [Bacteroidetes bacterium GWF2_35_48]OFY79997.1 MAG: isoprenoid biosynthesis protein ElbB [Bacteroidetes bacterium RIFOXYA12_FULL_35_11]OFY92836.1 MAG: isoprenoid biosynthesis protein ElbB [Bacteroidetes bacterium RIFOXYC12_FULL_35_7]HBX51306.1 isoprenoid biosynthesis protein ElbB [Bacteroidales bacterium]